MSGRSGESGSTNVSNVFPQILFSALRVVIAVAAVLALLWWFGIRMPGKNISKAAPLSPDEVTLREELRADVQKLAGEIGERNMWHYPQLNAAADFIENSFSRAGLHPRRDSYELRGQACHNIEAEIPGTHPEIILIGAHYDSVFGSPGANDNGSGVAATLALARRFAGRKPATHLALCRVRERGAALFFVGRNGKSCLRRQMQSARRQNLRHDQPRNDRLFFRCAAFTDLSIAWTGYLLSKSWQLHRIRQQRSFTGATASCYRSFPQTRKDSI